MIEGDKLIYLYVGIGGLVGAVFRYLIGIIFTVEGSTFPLATLIVNLLGSFLLAYITFFISEKFMVSAYIKAMLTTGLLGSFTTFSTFSLETIQLMEHGQVIYAVIYVIISLVGGLVLAYIGFLSQRKIVNR